MIKYDFESWLTPDAIQRIYASAKHLPWRTIIVSDDARDIGFKNDIELKRT
jgi:hypothetical protein